MPTHRKFTPTTATARDDIDVLECVVNISEGRDATVLAELADSCRDALDVHTDEFHNRSVFTLVGVEAPQRLAAAAFDRLDVRTHAGVHPRIGVVDVVPFVPLVGSTMAEAIEARDAFATWAAHTLEIPSFIYGPERTLPEVRHGAFTSIPPDFGPTQAHPTAGACAIGARDVLIAYNVWVESTPNLATVRRLAARVRSTYVRTLGLAVGDRFQVSCNLIAPEVVGPAALTATVARLGKIEGVTVAGCELVGLLPDSVLEAIEPAAWPGLDLSSDRTITARLKR